jgi:hypothetical protein
MSFHMAGKRSKTLPTPPLSSCHEDPPPWGSSWGWDVVPGKTFNKTERRPRQESPQMLLHTTTDRHRINSHVSQEMAILRGRGDWICFGKFILLAIVIAGVLNPLQILSIVGHLCGRYRLLLRCSRLPLRGLQSVNATCNRTGNIRDCTPEPGNRPLGTGTIPISSSSAVGYVSGVSSDARSTQFLVRSCHPRLALRFYCPNEYLQWCSKYHNLASYLLLTI